MAACFQDCKLLEKIEYWKESLYRTLLYSGPSGSGSKNTNANTNTKMLENRPEDALDLLVLTVYSV